MEVIQNNGITVGKERVGSDKTEIKKKKISGDRTQSGVILHHSFEQKEHLQVSR